MTRTLSLLAALALTLGVSVHAKADSHNGPAVFNVLTFEISDLDAFVALAKRASQIQARLETGGTQRVLLSTFSGTATGTPVVVLEYPDLATFAAAETKMGNSDEWSAFEADVAGAGIRILSSSVSLEITP